MSESFYFKQEGFKHPSSSYRDNYDSINWRNTARRKPADRKKGKPGVRSAVPKGDENLPESEIVRRL